MFRSKGPATTREADLLSPETVRFIASATNLDVAVLYRLMVVENQTRQRQILQGRLIGLAALALMLSTVMVLAIVGQPWVAGVVGGTSLVAVVAVFVTGQYQPAPLPALTQPAGRSDERTGSQPYVSQSGPPAGSSESQVENPA